MDYLIKINEQLAGAPVGVLVFALCVVLGYVLLIWNIFPNKWISPWVFFIGTILFVGGNITSCPTEGWRVTVAWFFRMLLEGLIVPSVAELVRRKGLSKFEDKIPILKDLLPDDVTITAEVPKTTTPEPPHA